MAYTTTDQHPSAATASRVAPENGTALNGLKAISAYAGKSVNTLSKLIREEGFPAVKIGGEWCSDTRKIDEWRMGRIGQEG
jgi:hypothetical protein